ncbi:hemerythrin domain-containing protein [Chloroflexota bacterium]
MSDNLAIINRVIEEHHTVRGNIKLAGETVNDLEAMARARSSHADWSQSSVQDLAEHNERLQQAVSYLADGLQNHFSFEEQSLPPLLGKPLMAAFVLEHGEIREKLAAVKSKVAGSRIEGLGQPEMLAAKSNIQQLVTGLSHMIEEHAGREEVILGMVKRALEAGKAR